MSGDATQTIDISKVILETTNSICSSFLESIDSKIYNLLDKMIFIDSSITKDSNFEAIFGTSPTKGILILANCLLFAFVLYYCIRLLTAQFSGTENESPGRFFLRVIISAILMNCSLDICNLLINGANQISSIFISIGSDLFKTQISFQSLINTLQNASSNNFNIFSLNGILSATLSISAITLLANFAFRYILVKLLILSAPFAFLCFSNKTTEPFLKSWYRTFLTMLLIQIVISVLLIIPYAILKDHTDQTFNQILLIGSISALLKSSQIVKEFFGGIGINSNFQAGISGIKSMFSRWKNETQILLPIKLWLL